MPTFPQQVGNWWLLECLGSGFSGSIFRAVNIHTNQVVALKLQDVNHECPTNRYERGFYPALQGGEGMPTLWAAGVEGRWDYLAIDLLGLSLDTLFKRSHMVKMDLRSVCCIAMQVITRLEFMHSRGILHRDIQLGNCVVGFHPNQTTVYMIDFGFSKRYIDPHTKRHIPDSKAKRDFIGNYWFSSVGVHCRGKVPSRRDDLEALALMLIHLLTPGGLPWTRNGVPRTSLAQAAIRCAKAAARPEDLASGLPGPFEEFLRYCRRLQFAETPDYEHWREEFRALAEEKGYGTDDAFIWPPLPEPVAKPAPPPTPARQTPGLGSVERVLNDLARLKLDNRPILGDRKNIARPTAPAPAAAQPPPAKKPAITSVGSSDSELVQPPTRTHKAALLGRIARSAQAATDNGSLARVLHEFTEVLRASRAKGLTREGFAVLDAVYVQLVDPSVYAVPLRTSRTRSGVLEGEGGLEVALGRREKVDALTALRREVARASENTALGALVKDFGALTDRSTGRTVTKDGLAFLEGVKTRLEVLGGS